MGMCRGFRGQTHNAKPQKQKKHPTFFPAMPLIRTTSFVESPFELKWYLANMMYDNVKNETRSKNDPHLL